MRQEYEQYSCLLSVTVKIIHAVLNLQLILGNINITVNIDDFTKGMGRLMKIRWFGHACFLFTSSKNTRVLTDPFDKKVGYALPEVEADVVTTSHDHYDHNNIGIIGGKFEHIGTPGIYKKDDIEIKGISTFHDENEGAQRGENIVFKYDIDGVRLCHCGDIGHILTERQVKEIGEVDVLLLPVGGVYTVDSEGALKLMEQLRPEVTIPMHFKTEALSFRLEGVEKFLARAGGEKLEKSEIEIRRENLAGFPKVLVLDYR